MFISHSLSAIHCDISQIQLDRVPEGLGQTQSHSSLHPETKKHDLSRIKYCMAGAAPVSPELTRSFQKVLPNCWIGQGYDK
ncbi:hypothetical protein FRB93_009687 [Tulasnella sp. JGI-2019a]|nr:hypothetical protein FRB93_009687 [Tulasnella sp. JGI-2019a]